MKWTRDGLGFVCPHCATPNPDNGPVCGNCGQDPFVLPIKDELLTEDQLYTLQTVKGKRTYNA